MAIIFQWSDPSHAERRYPGKELMFEGDLPDGGVRCQCGFCHQMIDILDGMEECPQCKNHLVFPRADW